LFFTNNIPRAPGTPTRRGARVAAIAQETQAIRSGQASPSPVGEGTIIAPVAARGNFFLDF